MGTANAGSAGAVVLLHGQPSVGVALHGVVLGLQAVTDLPVIAVDRPGYGSNPTGATDYPGNVAWLIRHLDEHKITRTVLVGHSWAGGVAQLAASWYPDRIAGVVLVCSIGPGCLLVADRLLAAPMLPAAVMRAGFPLVRPLLRRRDRSALLRNLPPAAAPLISESLDAQFARDVWRSFLLEERALTQQLPMLVAALPGISAATLVLAGSTDSVVPRQTPRELMRRIPGARLRIVPGADHMLPLYRPASVVDAVLDLGVLPRR